MISQIIAPTRNIEEVIDQPVTFTDGWQKIGARIQTVGFSSILLWLDLEINDSTKLYFRAQAVAERTDPFLSGYSLPTEEIFVGINKFYPKVYEIQKLEDQRVIFQVPIANLIKYIDIEIMDNSDVVANRAVVKSLRLTAAREL